MQAHTTQVAVPAAADSWTDMTAIVVPAGVTRLVKVCVALAVDEADPAGVRFAPLVRLIGSGLMEQSPHVYVGPCGNIAAKTTSGACSAELNPVCYDVDIAVAVGGTIQAQTMTPDEAITAGTISCGLIFDTGTVKQANSMSDWVDAAMATTAGGWYTVGTLTVPQMEKGKAPTKIRMIVMAIATDQATIALLRCASRFRLSGSGLAEGGLHEFLGPHSGTGCNTAGILGYDRQTVPLEVEMTVNAGGTILVEHYLTTETPTAGTAIFGVLYA